MTRLRLLDCIYRDADAFALNIPQFSLKRCYWGTKPVRHEFVVGLSLLTYTSRYPEVIRNAVLSCPMLEELIICAFLIDCVRAFASSQATCVSYSVILMKKNYQNVLHYLDAYLGSGVSSTRKSLPVHRFIVPILDFHKKHSGTLVPLTQVIENMIWLFEVCSYSTLTPVRCLIKLKF
ncbi:hypothetical protein CEXT_106891 [Caerostris extrusa]|uniref:Uncharacterized protein n=1 Tax=Caerostris extrusa TaxID=172846 RepID=A0AAV4QJV5_CAEEX|nr:hypothetical protein CEXT_106891 [Caerostris extrusa]